MKWKPVEEKTPLMMGQKTLSKHSFPLSVRLKAKWGLPQITNAFIRHRLFETLDGLTERQCTWLVAPGGYGKSYLMQSYVKRDQRPAIWYNLDEGDSDIVTFFADFSESLETAGRGPILRLSQDVQDLSRFSRLYFQQLAEQIETPTLVILDDYHRITAESGLHEMIAAAIGYLPASIHLVVLSREAPPSAFARAQAHLHIGLIGADELALTDDEAHGIARLVMEEQITDHDILEARRRVDGWAVGFMVLLGQSDPSNVAPESVTTLFHYFEHEVLNATTDEMCLFLWQTALFQNFSAEMAERLTGRKDAAAILRGLVSGNYFLQVNQSTEPVYHYHDLFRDYLLDYGRFKHADGWRDAALCAADILSDNDEPDAAASLYAELADWECLGKLINHHGGQLLQRGSHRTLSRWLTLLPNELKDQQPWLVYWDGCARLATNPKHARERLRQAFALFVREDERHGALLAWAAVCQAFWIAFDDMRPLNDWFRELEALWPGHEPVLPPEIEAQVAIGAFLCQIVTKPDDPELFYWEKRLTRLLESSCNPELNTMAATLLMFHFVWTVGDRGRARMLRDVLRSAESLETIAPMTLVITRSWGDFSYEYGFGGSLSRCLESLHAARNIAAARGVHLYDATLYGGMAYCHLTSGHVDVARQALDQMGEALNWERTYDAGFYFWLREWEAWLDGRYTEASDLGRQERTYADRFGLMHPWPMSHLAAAQTMNSLGRRAQALRHLAEIGRWARHTQSRIGIYIRGLALAQFSLESGRRERVRRILRATLPLGQVEGYAGPPFFRPSDVTKLCAEALSAGIESDYITRVIRSRELPAPKTMEFKERWPWRVKVCLLGKFMLELDGSPYASVGKGQQKPLELLKVLVALGGESVPWEQLADMLWPNVEGDMAASNFKTTLSRLRKLLGQHEFLLIREGVLSLNRKYCWTDVWRFAELAREIEAAAQPNGDAVLATRTEALVQRLGVAYPRPLLCGGREDWIAPIRRRMHDRYARCNEKLARLMERTEAHELAADIRASALSLDDAGCF
jgi:LuxR family maltose regulon positive regulatory protein